MFFRLFAFLALVAVACASPKPEPQAFVYTAGTYPAAYSAYPYYSGAYTPYAATAAAYPYAYNAYYIR